MQLHSTHDKAQRTDTEDPRPALDWLAPALGADLLGEANAWVDEATRLIEERLDDGSHSTRPGLALIHAGGKRARLLLTVLAGMGGGASREVTVVLAAAAELVHTATLIHDDVIDGGVSRRGEPAAHIAVGNKRAVLAGDALLTRSLQLLGDSELHRATQSLLQVTAALVEGEYLQMDALRRLPADPATAERINRLKTATLFAWCASVPLAQSGADPAAIEGAHTFGLRLGEAFQTIDDLLDLVGDTERLGKEPLRDVLEGKINLSLAMLLERSPEVSDLLEAIWRAHDAGEDTAKLRGKIVDAARSVGMEQAIANRVSECVRDGIQALESFPPGPIREALAQLSGSLAERTW